LEHDREQVIIKKLRELLWYRSNIDEFQKHIDEVDLEINIPKNVAVRRCWKNCDFLKEEWKQTFTACSILMDRGTVQPFHAF